MKYLFLLIILLSLGSLTVSAQAPADITSTAPIIIGGSITFHSDILDEDRQLNIYLPIGYSPDSAKSYPVIYLLDGSLHEDFQHITGLVQFGSYPWIQMIPESIVVGIENIDRKKDFTHKSRKRRYKKEFPTTGSSAAFIDFLAKEVSPLVDAMYPTTAMRTIIGQSLGGLLAAEILYTHPEMFDQYIIVSPSLWWDDEYLLGIEPAPFSTPKTIYIAAGDGEGPVMERTSKTMAQQLNARESVGTTVRYDLLSGFDHGNMLHQAAYNGFEFIHEVVSGDDQEQEEE